MTPWLASLVRRWHCNPHLSHTVDLVAAHSGRMGIMALEIFGRDASRELLAACLVHDLGEWATGDIPFDAKRDPDLRDASDRLEATALADMGLLFDLSARDARRLKYLDRLDAYLWAQHHAPQLLTRQDWRDQRAWLDAEREEVR
jgi:5'-deoxynucleotidase YfbR-like HD superfamily hydrolase